MVTRTVMLVTPSEAAAFAATTTSSSAAVADSIISNVPAEQNHTEEELQTNNLFNYPSYTKRAQHPSPGGLVQLCRHNGCFHAVDFERRGGLCCIHQKGPMDGEQNDPNDSEDDAKIRGVTGDECCLDDEVGKKRGHPSMDSISNNKTKKRQSIDVFVLDLTGVPPQSPIPKSAGCIKEGASKYKGVFFYKPKNKWQAQISIDGKLRFIGYYENEEEAAVDYARALVKYRGQGALEKAREQNSFFDLSGVPPQLPIPKSKGRIKDGASKYTGVFLNKPTKKWIARIDIEGKKRVIGNYENEEEAAVDYARAVFKYRGQGALDRAREAREQNSVIIDLTGVPPQSPIPKSAGRIREGASKYVGVSFNKPMNKWQAQIKIDGKNRHIGYNDSEEEAAADYARAAFKYKGQGALDKARERSSR
jgi:hypothetical protein